MYGIDISCLIDTGATLSIIHPEKYYAIPQCKRPPIQSSTNKLRMGDGGLVSPIGSVIIPLEFSGQIIPHRMIIADIEAPAVLGYDFLYENAGLVNIRERYVTLNGSNIPCQLESKMPSVFRIILRENVVVPANTEVVVNAKVEGNYTELNNALIEPYNNKLANIGILVSKDISRSEHRYRASAVG